MGLWLYDDRRGEQAPEMLYQADAATTVLWIGVAAGLVDLPAPPTAEIIDFRAARLARLAEQGPDA